MNEIINLINTRYNPAYSGVGPDVKSILNSECFDNKLNENSFLHITPQMFCEPVKYQTKNTQGELVFQAY